MNPAGNYVSLPDFVLFITSLQDCAILTNLLFFHINESFTVVKVLNPTFELPVKVWLFQALHIRTNHIQAHVGQIGLPIVIFRVLIS